MVKENNRQQEVSRFFLNKILEEREKPLKV